MNDDMPYKQVNQILHHHNTRLYMGMLHLTIYGDLQQNKSNILSYHKSGRYIHTVHIQLHCSSSIHSYTYMCYKIIFYDQWMHHMLYSLQIQLNMLYMSSGTLHMLMYLYPMPLRYYIRRRLCLSLLLVCWMDKLSMLMNQNKQRKMYDMADIQNYHLSRMYPCNYIFLYLNQTPFVIHYYKLDRQYQLSPSKLDRQHDMLNIAKSQPQFGNIFIGKCKNSLKD